MVVKALTLPVLPVLPLTAKDFDEDRFLMTGATDTVAARATMSSTAPGPTFDIEYVRLTVSSMVARMKANVSIETIRPLPLFLGLASGPTTNGGVQLSEGAFIPPSTETAALSQLRARVNDNLKFFLSNYALVAAMTALVVLLMHPILIVFLSMIYCLWWIHGYLIVNEVNVLTIPVHAILTVQQRFYLLFGISAVAIVFSCFIPAAIFVVISGIIILAHAALRDTAHLHEGSQREVKSSRESAPTNDGGETDELLSKV